MCEFSSSSSTEAVQCDDGAVEMTSDENVLPLNNTSIESTEVELEQDDVDDIGVAASGTDRCSTVAMGSYANITTAAAVHYSNDPADWVINADLLEYFACNRPVQNCDVDFVKSARKCGEETVGYSGILTQIILYEC